MTHASIKSGLAGLVALGTSLLAVPSEAGSLSASKSLAIGSPSTVETVDYRRHYGRGHYGHRRGNGIGIGLGIAGAVIGGAIIADQVNRGRYYSGQSAYDYGDGGDSGYDRCARAFRSFDPDSGTYTGYDGQTRRCPYL
jgi:BA14K-like protein